MKIKIPFIVSLIFNALFILFLILSLSSKKAFFYYNSEAGHIASAVVASVPFSDKNEIVFGVIEIAMGTGEKAYLQYSFCTDDIKQANMVITSLYDPEIISVKNTGYGIEITALSRGSTLMQTLANNGIKDVALITVK